VSGVNILATSGGFRPGKRTMLTVGPMIEFALELAGSPQRPKFCYVGTALGDNPSMTKAVYDAFLGRDVEVSGLAAFPMPSVDDVRAHLLAQDVVWVGGGSVAGLLAMWRLHGWDAIFREVWEAGVVLGGVSAGSLCWHIGGTTDSFGPELRPVSNGLALLPYSNGVHYDSEEQRRPLYHQLIADEVLPDGYATDDGVGLHYRGTDLVEAVSDRPGAKAYRVQRSREGGKAIEDVIEPRRLD
jgi:peptidase E